MIFEAACIGVLITMALALVRAFKGPLKRSNKSQSHSDENTYTSSFKNHHPSNPHTRVPISPPMSPASASAPSWESACTRILSSPTSTLTVPGVRVIEFAKMTRPSLVFCFAETTVQVGLMDFSISGARMRLMTSILATTISLMSHGAYPISLGLMGWPAH